MAETNDLNTTDDDILMESLLTPSDFESEVSVEEPAADVVPAEIDTKKKDTKPSYRLGERYSPGTELVPDASEYKQRSSYATIQKHVYQGARNEGKSIDEAYDISRKTANHAFLSGSLDDPLLEDYEPPTGIISASGRILTRRRIIDTQDRKATSAFEERNEEQLRQERAYRSLIKEEGSMSQIVDAFKGADPMSEDEAKELFIQPVFKRDPENKYLSLPEFSDDLTEGQTFFGRDLGESPADPDAGFIEDPYIPYGIKNIPDLAERAAVKAGLPAMFTDLFIEQDEKDAYLKSMRTELPTENFKKIVDRVETSRNKGMNDDQIKKNLRDELAFALTMQSWSDLPTGFQVKKPSIEIFSDAVKANPDLFDQTPHKPLAVAAQAVLDGAEKSVIQRALNRVALGYMPNSVVAGSIPSTVNLIDEAIKAADRVIEARGQAGSTTERRFRDTMFSTEKIGNEVQVVENTLGKLFRALGIFQAGIQEVDITAGITQQDVKEFVDVLGLPEEATEYISAGGPIKYLAFMPFLASRDFYFNYGIRDVDSTWLSRVLARIATGDVGYISGLTDEAKAQGFDVGDREYQLKLAIGMALDFIVPWEKLHIGPVAHSTKAAARGSSLVKKLGTPGYRTRAFLAGASPALYDRIYNVSERASLAMDGIKSRVGDKPDQKALQALLAQDDAFRQAETTNQPLPKNELGGDVEPLTLNERNFTEDIIEQMAEGESFDKAFESIKRNYKPNVFETSADVAAAVTRHVIENSHSLYLFSRGAPGSPNYKPGIIPWQLEPQLERVLAAAGIKYSDVKAGLNKDIGGKSTGYLAALRAMVVSGADIDTLDLRSSEPYLKFRKEIEDLVNQGIMNDEQKVVLLSIMETRAHNSSAIGSIKTISEPEDFFAQAKVKTVTPKLSDGTLGKTNVRVQVGKATADINLKSVDQFIDILKAEDNLSMTRLFGGDGELLVDLMGKGWVQRFFGRFNNTENVGRSRKMPKRMLTEKGRTAAETKLRSVIEASGRLSSETLLMRELYANLSSVYARLGADAKQTLLRPSKIAKLNALLQPEEFFKNAAVVLNRARPRRPGTVVRVSTKLQDLMEEEVRRAAGTKRVFSDIDVVPEYVKQGLGVTKRTTQIDAGDALARAVGFVVAETMKKQESQFALRGMDIVRISAASFADKKNAPLIRNKVNARMASVLGIASRKGLTGRKYLKADSLKEMADPKTETLTLSEGQQASFRVFLQRLASEPFVAKKIPDELLGANGKVDVISFEHYNRIVELTTDVEASAYSRRSVYTEAIPRSLAYSLLSSLRAEGADAIAAIDTLNDVVNKFKEAFVLDDPLKNIRPELREVLTRELSKLEQVKPEVRRMIRDARRNNPEATIEQIFDSLRNQLEEDFRVSPDKVNLLVGEYDIYTGKLIKKGILTILNDLSESEIARINRNFAKAEKAETVPTLTADQKKIVAGEDKLKRVGKKEKVEFDRGLGIKPEVSRIQYITQNATRSLLQDLCDTGGINGISERVASAFVILEKYSTENGLTKADIAKLSDQERVLLASAIEEIRNQLNQHAQYLKRRGGIILDGMAGGRFNVSKFPEFANGGEKALAASAAAYREFHRGGKGFKNLYKFMTRIGAALDADPKKMSRYSPAQAYLEMIVRLMAEDKIIGMYDELIKVGMPGAKENYRIPKRKVSPTGAEYSIETPHVFYQRVRSYMDMIFNRSMDIETEVRYADNTREVIKNVPGGEYRFASFEHRGRSFDTDPTDFADLDAALAAEEILVRFGVRTASAGQELTEIAFPDGSVAYGPKAIADEIEGALARTAGVGSAYGRKAQKILSAEEFGFPYAGVQPKELRIRNYGRAANFINSVGKVFPLSFGLIKRGVTTGLVIPNPAYYTANFMGGALQLITAVDPVKATTMLVKNPRMVGAVMARMFGDGEHTSATIGGVSGLIAGGVAGSAAGPLGAVAGGVLGAAGGAFTGKKIGKGYQPFGNHMIVTKNGMIYNADQIAEMAVLSRLNSSYISSETQTAFADEIKNYLRENPSIPQQTYAYGAAWNSYLADCATAIDSFYRISIFVDGLNDGIAPSQAASVARKAAFDYNALTDFEKQYVRNLIMFYSYMKKNMELFYDTLMTNPSRVTNQLRVTNGLHRASLEEDPQLVLKDYVQPRLMVALKSALQNTHAIDNRMYVLPPVPITDSLNVILDMYDTVRGDEESQRMLFTKLTPWIQAAGVLTLDVDPFFGNEINRYNKVPPFLMEWDLAITGGVLRRSLNVQRETHRNPRLRLVEGDEDRQYYRAYNGELWWLYRNMLQIPGAGRSLGIIDQLDRSNIGVVEGITELLRGMRLYAEETGLADEREFEFVEGDTMSPRVGMTPLDEFLGIFGVRTELVPNARFARGKLLKDIEMTYKKKYPISTDPVEQALEKRIRKKVE